MTKEQMEQIVLANMQKIYLYCVRRLGNATDAEDVASDITVELLASYSRVRDDSAVTGYVWAVADTLCRNYWRKAGMLTALLMFSFQLAFGWLVVFSRTRSKITTVALME